MVFAQKQLINVQIQIKTCLYIMRKLSQFSFVFYRDVVNFSEYHQCADISKHTVSQKTRHQTFSHIFVKY